jgi:hypothetical protein
MPPELYIPGQSDHHGRGVTVFLQGRPGTRKTTFAGMWPNPVFLSMKADGGERVLSFMPHFYGIDTPPVFGIGSCQEFVDALNIVATQHQQYGWATVVIDTLSTYVDMFIDFIITKRRASFTAQGKTREAVEAMMEQRDWGYLENHLVKDIAGRLHTTGLNVIWITHVKEKTTQGANGPIVHSVDPAISGSSARKLPAICQLMIHADVSDVPSLDGRGLVNQYRYYTAPTHLCKNIRHRFGPAWPKGELLDPATGEPGPHYADVYQWAHQYVYFGPSGLQPHHVPSVFRQTAAPTAVSQ